MTSSSLRAPGGEKGPVAASRLACGEAREAVPPHGHVGAPRPRGAAEAAT